MGFCDLAGRHFGGDFVPHVCKLLLIVTIDARSGQIKPQMSCHVVLPHAFTLAVHCAEGVLRIGLTLFGCLEKPLSRFGIVLSHAIAMVVHYAEEMLRQTGTGTTLFGCLEKPLSRFGTVPRKA
jgi:hypothetical protein